MRPFFESKYGGGAAQEWIYRSPGFAILLAFLGMNILCAALIRFPWKKRQTGFVVTHAGLLDPAGRLLLQRADRRRGTGWACSRETSKASWCESTIP